MTEEIVYPILQAYHDEYGLSRVWCEYCCQWHQHGSEDGHRLPHCHVVDSAYLRHGYILKHAGEWTAEIQKQHRTRRTVNCKSCRAFLSPVGDRKCPKCARERAEQEAASIARYRKQ